MVSFPMRNIRLNFIFCCFLLTNFIRLTAQDAIILRSGEEIEGKILKSTQTEVIIEEESKNGLFGEKKHRSTTIFLSDVYMLKYKERGNYYLDSDGTKISGEKQKIDKSADIVYLIMGKEIPAWNLSLDANNITFQTTKDKKKAESNTLTLKRSAVFMIKYSDGSRDIITDIQPKESVAANQPINGEQEKEDSTPQFKVLFHSVKKGDTLGSVASQYDVSEDDLKEWNELSPQMKSGTRLKTGTQLLIQIPIEK